MHLVCQEGPLQGQRIALSAKDGKRLILGRQEGCEIHLDSPRVSRKHAELEICGNRVFIRDLGSQNGVYLNETRLVATAQGEFVEVLSTDRILLGDYAFTLAEDESSTMGPFVPVRKSDLDLRPHLALVYGAYRALAKARNATDFLAALAATLMRSIRPERICMMVFDPAQKTLVPLAFQHRQEGMESADFEPSMAILHQVLNQKKPVFSVDTGLDPALPKDASIAAAGIRSIACMPIVDADSLKGALYVDTLQSSGTTLDGEAKKTLEIVADLAASGLIRFEKPAL